MLRNKKTGAIFTKPLISVAPYSVDVRGCHIKTYRSIDELLEEWEDYKPKEPLIKDEKIRKAVRAWADGNDIDTDEQFYVTSPTFDNKFLTIEKGGLMLSSYYDDESIKDGSYTIAELCGEEEE